MILDDDVLLAIAQLDPGHIADRDSAAVDPLDDHFFDFLRSPIFPQDTQYVPPFAFVEVAGTGIGVFFPQGRNHFVDRQAIEGEGVGLEDDLKLPLTPAE